MPRYLAGDEEDWPSASPSPQPDPDIKVRDSPHPGEITAAPAIKSRDSPIPEVATPSAIIKTEPQSPGTTVLQRATRDEWSTSNSEGDLPDPIEADTHTPPAGEDSLILAQFLAKPPGAESNASHKRMADDVADDNDVDDDQPQPKRARPAPSSSPSNYEPSRPTSPVPPRTDMPQNRHSAPQMTAMEGEIPGDTPTADTQGSATPKSTSKRVPKPRQSAGKFNNTEFLAACIKHSKEKVRVNFESLAKDVGMSTGGAANKFRALMKQLAKNGAVWAEEEEEEPTKPKKSKPKVNTTTQPQTNGGEVDGCAVIPTTIEQPENPQAGNEQSPVVLD